MNLLKMSCEYCGFTCTIEHEVSIRTDSQKYHCVSCGKEVKVKEQSIMHIPV